jgi:hypothetical protein
MNITKAEAKQLLGISTDTALADFFGISKQAFTRIGNDDHLPDGRMWELRAKRPDLWPTPADQAEAA